MNAPTVSRRRSSRLGQVMGWNVSAIGLSIALVILILFADLLVKTVG